MGIEEVSEKTGIPVETLRHYRKLNKGPRSYKLGRRVRYDVADLATWLDAQRGAGVRGGVEA